MAFSLSSKHGIVKPLLQDLVRVFFSSEPILSLASGQARAGEGKSGIISQATGARGGFQEIVFLPIFSMLVAFAACSMKLNACKSLCN